MHDLGQHQADLQDYQAHLFQLYILELLPNRSWLVGHFRYMLYRGFTDRSFQISPIMNGLSGKDISGTLTLRSL